MKWWHEARFGMFIHWGYNSVLEDTNAVMVRTRKFPVVRNEPLAKQFHPSPSRLASGPRLARERAWRYMVMTTKHHEGFCHFDTKTTDYLRAEAKARTRPVREYVTAARGEGSGSASTIPDGLHHPTARVAPRTKRRESASLNTFTHTSASCSLTTEN